MIFSIFYYFLWSSHWRLSASQRTSTNWYANFSR